ncbi:MAG: sulfatase [Candidatus Sumerlaeota bacterium]
MSKPNLLFIYTDEQAISTLKAYGNDQIEMPNLNRFSEQCVVFEKAYVTQPVCTPSRSTLLTGQYPHSNGCVQNNIPLRPDTKCVPEMVSDQYVTAHHGKWHLGDEIFAQHGFEEFVSIEDMYIGYYSEGRDREERSDYHHYLVDQGFTPNENNIFQRHITARYPEEHTKAAFVADNAARFLKEHRDDPFVLFVNFLEPHMPFFGPRDDMYDRDSIPLPDNFEDIPDKGVPVRLRAHYKRRHGAGGPDEEAEGPEKWKDLIARYWGLASMVDTQVGKIFDALEELGLDENTIVVFTSDHGDMMGAHGLVAKCVQYEEAVRVPLFIRMPGQKQGHRVKGAVSQIDVVPTVLDLMGEPRDPQLEGKSLRKWLEDPNLEGPEEDIIIEWNSSPSGLKHKDGLLHQQGATAYADVTDYEDDTLEDIVKSASAALRTIITPDGWKLNASEVGDHELYNLKDDPLEMNNLAGDPNYTDKMEELLGRIEKWQEKTGDKVKLQHAWDPIS